MSKAASSDANGARIAVEDRQCPECRRKALAVVLDLPHCEACGWTGRVIV